MIQESTQRKLSGRKWLAGSLMLGLALGCSGIGLQAQGDVPPPPPGAAGAPQMGGPGAPGEMPDMTPEQRRARQAEMREQALRNRLTSAGFSDTGLQDAVVAFVSDREKAAAPLQEAGRKVNQALRDTAATDAQISTLMGVFRAGVNAERARRAKALKELDAETGFGKKPRLEALLTMEGIIGDEADLAGMGAGGRGGGPGARGGQGGRGGRQGGQGGRGGQGQGGRGRRGGGQGGAAQGM